MLGTFVLLFDIHSLFLGIFQVYVPQSIIKVLNFLFWRDIPGKAEGKRDTQPDFMKDCGDQLILQSELTAAIIGLRGAFSLVPVPEFSGPSASPPRLATVMPGSEA